MLKNRDLQNELDSRSMAIMTETNRAARETALTALKRPGNALDERR